MIKFDEGYGGWTITVVNGNKTTRLECSRYIVTRNGIKWYDLDKAMKDAKKLNGKQK